MYRGVRWFRLTIGNNDRVESISYVPVGAFACVRSIDGTDNGRNVYPSSSLALPRTGSLSGLLIADESLARKSAFNFFLLFLRRNVRADVREPIDQHLPLRTTCLGIKGVVSSSTAAIFEEAVVSAGSAKIDKFCLVAGMSLLGGDGVRRDN